MIFLNILLIVIRILCSLNVAGFVLGWCLHEKHEIFQKIFEGTGCCMIFYGFAAMWAFAVLGF